MTDITRRAFIETSVLAAASVATDAFADVPPDTPTTPVLSGGDQAARGSDFLVVAWEAVPGANSYDVQLISRGGTELRQALAARSVLNTLIPNRQYEIRVRAVNASGVSAFSTPLMTVTRPPIPAPLTQELPSMIAPSADVTLSWNLTAIAATGDDSNGIGVQLGRGVDAASASLLVGSMFSDALPLTKNGFQTPFVAGAQIFIRMVAQSNLAADGLNISAWSLGLMPSVGVFSELRVPSTEELRRVAIGMLRDYYA